MVGTRASNNRKGKAGRTATTFLTSQGQVDSFDSLKLVLLERFGDVRGYEARVASFQSMVRSRGETIVEFAERCELLGCKIRARTDLTVEEASWWSSTDSQYLR